ncbi:MAG: YceI family protein [Pseudomonadota bacterium]|nr:MAG: YceI family protein [Pseudomonadota bacterium]
MIRIFSSIIVALVLIGSAQAGERYLIDTRGSHAFIQFKISHLGFSWLHGRFNDFEGEFTFDPNDPARSSVNVTIQTASIDSNHDRRDEHLRNDDFLAVKSYPEAQFRSTSFEPLGEDRYRMTGDFTLLGQTRSVTVDVQQVGAGQDPWGGFRRGFEGHTTLTLSDFGIDYDLGPDARQVEIILSVEGIRQDGQ